jgi:hypothetical protein
MRLAVWWRPQAFFAEAGLAKLSGLAAGQQLVHFC